MALAVTSPPIHSFNGFWGTSAALKSLIVPTRGVQGLFCPEGVYRGLGGTNSKEKEVMICCMSAFFTSSARSGAAIVCKKTASVVVERWMGRSR